MRRFTMMGRNSPPSPPAIVEASWGNTGMAARNFPALVEGRWRELLYGRNIRLHISPCGVFTMRGAVPPLS